MAKSLDFDLFICLIPTGTLGNDASEDFHTYAFEWHKDRIVWYVDGKEVHRVTKDLPQTKMRIMANVWAGIGVDDWLSPFNDSDLPLSAEYP